MPIVNSYQAEPSAVADFAQETGYLQEKTRQIATQKAYNNHLAEIDLQYRNQSELSRQSAIQRAALTKQENEYREEYAQKSYQRNLKTMAASLEMKGDYQSRIMAEQFHAQSDRMLANEKIRKEARGWSYSPSAQREQMDIKQQIQAINSDPSISIQDKAPEIQRLQRQLETMVPDQEPKNYIPNNSKQVVNGNTYSVDSSGNWKLITDSENHTEKEREGIQKAREINLRAENERKAQERLFAHEKEVARIKAAENAARQNKKIQINKQKASKAQHKAMIASAYKANTAAEKYTAQSMSINSQVDALKRSLQEKTAEMSLYAERMQNPEHDETDKENYYKSQSDAKAIEQALASKQIQRNQLNIQANAMKQKSIRTRVEAGDNTAIDDIEAAAARNEPWAIDYIRQEQARRNAMQTASMQ